MSHAANDLSPVSETLETIYQPICHELDQVEESLREEFTTAHEALESLVQHGYRLGGKRLRPALVLLSAKACGGLTEDHIKLATAVELIHTATLIHDDVLDEAEIRRHQDTVNARWGNEASILLGDYLLARALCLASSFETVTACRVIAEASRVVCEGELCQVVNRGNYDLSEDDYYSIISGKTAALCSCCCQLGAHYAGADTATEAALYEYGQDLGIAFQIVDDLLDLSGQEERTGKSLGTDLVKQKPTLPLIRVLNQLDETERKELTQKLAEGETGDRAFLKPWLEQTDALEYARHEAVKRTQLAVERLENLPSSDAADALRNLADFVIRRRH